MSRRPRAERGATAVLVALSMVALLGSVAVVIDLGATRSQRASTQGVTDSATTAAAIALGDAYNDGDFSGRQGCETARDYLVENLEGVSSLSGLDCASWTADCIGTPAARELTQTAGDVTITIVHPVTNGHRLMDSSAIGAASQPVATADGDPCERIGIEIVASRGTTFAPVIGVDSSTTTVHTVALVERPIIDISPISLLLLERHECDVLATNGNGGIIVTNVIDTVTGDVFEGRIAADSDGTGSNCGPKYVVEPNSSETVRADGEPGCPGELAPLGSGRGCGEIEIFAPGTPGCNPPACRTGGNIAPDPEPLNERVTRAPIDHRYNCKPSYPASYDIVGCRPTATNGPYLDQLVAAVGGAGTPPGFQSYKASYPCTHNSGTLVIPQGNWHVDCKLNVKGTLRFQGGNVVFDNDVTVSGELEVNHNNAGSMSWSPGDPVDITASSGGASFAYFRSGLVEPKSSGKLILRNTFSHYAPAATLDGTGPIDITAPIEGPFADLAVWSESALDLKWTGGSSMALEGVVFAPNAGLTLRGSAGTTTVGAQLIVKRLDAGGSGVFSLSPKADRSVHFARAVHSRLIR